MTAREVVELPTREALTEAAAERFVAAAAEAIEARERFVVALSGGSTPMSLYALLATGRYAARIDWPRVHVCWGDERCVPPDRVESNYRSAREALLDHVPVPEENVHRIHGEDDPDAAAAAYERELRVLFRTPAGPPRTAAGERFDLVLLGMGEDGHTASIFPGSGAVHEERRWAIAERSTKTPRVTLTFPVLNAAAEVTFLVAGHEKAAMLRRVLDGPRQQDLLPAQRIAPSAGSLRWLVDADAAADLRRDAHLR